MPKSELKSDLLQFAIVILTLLAWAWFIWQLSADQTRARFDYYEASKASIAQFKHQTIEICTKLSAQYYWECLENALENRRNDAVNERNLVAQETMARWTWVMASVASLGFLISIVGILLIFATLKESRKAASSAMKTYGAYVAVERARLEVLVHRITGNADRFAAQLEVINIGKTDCVIFEARAEWQDNTRYCDGAMDLYLKHDLVVKAGERIYLPTCHESNAGNSFLKGSVFYKSPLSEQHRVHFLFEVEREEADSRWLVQRHKRHGFPEDV